MRAPACGDHPELHPFPTRRSSDLAVIGGAFAYPVSADEPVPPKSTSRTIEVHGQIVRVLPDQIIVDTRDRRNVVVWLRPLTKFVQNGQTMQITDLKVGANISAVFMVEGADTVEITG